MTLNNLFKVIQIRVYLTLELENVFLQIHRISKIYYLITTIDVPGTLYTYLYFSLQSCEVDLNNT